LPFFSRKSKKTVDTTPAAAPAVFVPPEPVDDQGALAAAIAAVLAMLHEETPVEKPRPAVKVDYKAVWRAQRF